MDNIKTRITLIRHGEPIAHGDYSPFSIISGKDIEKYVQAWNTCELNNKKDIPFAIKEIIPGGTLFLSSSLKRAQESFRISGVNTFEINNLFNEAELPYGMWKSIRMPLIIWLIILRLFWRLGFSINAEPYSEFIKRIRKCTEFIEEIGNEKHIIIMAHGFVNRMIKRELLKRNWKLLSGKGGHRYWSYSTLERL